MVPLCDVVKSVTVMWNLSAAGSAIANFDVAGDVLGMVSLADTGSLGRGRRRNQARDEKQKEGTH